MELQNISQIEFEVNVLPETIINENWIVDNYETLVNYKWNEKYCKVKFETIHNYVALSYILKGMNSEWHTKNLA